MEIVGWILWTVAAFFAGGGLIFLYRNLERGLMGQTIASIICQLILVGWPLVFAGFNKLHLLWLFPLTYAQNIATMPLMFWSKWLALLVPVGFYVGILFFLTS